MNTKTAFIHSLLMTLMAGVAVFVNATSNDDSLRAQDRDLFTLLRSDTPDVLRGLDLSSPEWLPFPSTDLLGIDLSGLDLRALRLSSRALTSVNLDGSHLEQAEFICARMTNVSFAGANLEEARLDYKNCNKYGPMVLDVRLNGANLSKAWIEGGNRDPQNRNCSSYLTIQGNLNGARFEGATLECVVLKNTSTSSDLGPLQPSYSGISFVNGKVNGLVLQNGNFLFSDFYRSRLRLLTVGPEADLRFSTLADLSCPKDLKFCELFFEFASGPAANGQVSRKLFSLNVRGSSISSNLPLPSATNDWPALLCNQSSRWELIPEDGPNESNSPKTSETTSTTTTEGKDDVPSFWIMNAQTNKPPVCSPLSDGSSDELPRSG